MSSADDCIFRKSDKGSQREGQNRNESDGQNYFCFAEALLEAPVAALHGLAF
jgi:hypothetical protein